MVLPRWLFAVLAVVALGTAGCSGDNTPLPDGPQLLQQAATATREVQTVRFTLDVQGTVSGISISRAQGQLTRDGKVKGTAVITSTGQPAEAEFVIVGDTMYLKGPTGGFQKLPSSVAASVYDPTKILDDNLGLAALVAGASQPMVRAKESVDGTAAYRVEVTFAQNNLGILLPGSGAASDLPGELWISEADPHRPIKAKVQVPGSGEASGGTVTITLTGFNDPADITAPS